MTHATVRRALWVALLGGMLAACDIPTSAPSLNTETGASAPVVVGKTFSLLGGPKSEHEPLIDTTTSRFDSVFTVGEGGDISIEETISSFDVGSLGQAMDKATEGMGASTTISETVIAGSDLARQNITAGFQRANGVPPPTASQSAESPIPYNGELQFPAGLLEVPDFETITAENATVQGVTLTEERAYEGSVVNELSFTLYNDPSDPAVLTDGEGNAPVIALQSPSGTILAEKRFESAVEPGESKEVRLDISGKTVGEGTVVALTIEGHDLQDRLTTEVSPLRYQEVTLDGVDQLDVRVVETGLSTRGSGARFAGVEARSGVVQLEVTNGQSFPIEIDSLHLQNRLEGSALPDTFPALDVLQSSGPIAPGESIAFDVDLEERGLTSEIDATLKAVSAQSGQTVTIDAGGSVGLFGEGVLTVGTMYFWPSGETLRAAGSLTLGQSRLGFDREGDFVELEEGTLSLSDFVSEPAVGFESLRMSFPGLRAAPYAPTDSIALAFVEDPSGEYEFSAIGPADGPRAVEADLGGLRLVPSGSEVNFHLHGQLESISPPTAENLRTIRFRDEVRGGVSIGELKVRALEAGISPFSVNLTEDSDGDGRLNLSDEARESSVEGFGSIAGRVEGLQVRGTELKIQVTTDVGTDAQLYAALQGRRSGARTFLAGRGSYAVSGTDPLGGDFYQEASQIPTENLLRLPIEGTSEGGPSPITRSLTLASENSSVDEFVSTLPSSLRFVGQARLTGDEGRIRLRRPLTFEAGLSASVPARIDSSFSVRDTLEADFSSLSDVTDPGKNVSITTSELEVDYENQVPLGARVRLIALNRQGRRVAELPSGEGSISIEPAPKAEDGTAEGARSGTATLTLKSETLRALAEGRQLVVAMTLDQATGATPATLRATDTIALSLRTKVRTSVRAGE